MHHVAGKHRAKPHAYSSRLVEYACASPVISAKLMEISSELVTDWRPCLNPSLRRISPLLYATQWHQVKWRHWLPPGAQYQVRQCKYWMWSLYGVKLLEESEYRDRSFVTVTRKPMEEAPLTLKNTFQRPYTASSSHESNKSSALYQIPGGLGHKTYWEDQVSS